MDNIWMLLILYDSIVTCDKTRCMLESFLCLLVCVCLMDSLMDSNGWRGFSWSASGCIMHWQ